MMINDHFNRIQFQITCTCLRLFRGLFGLLGVSGVSVDTFLMCLDHYPNDPLRKDSNITTCKLTIVYVLNKYT